MAYYSKGGDTMKVPMAMHKENRDRLLARFKDAPANGIMLFKGGETQLRYDTDTELPFRQESFFLYLFGTHHAGCLATIELSTKKSVLFIPRLPAEYAVWMGKILPPEDFKEKLEVDDVLFVDEIQEYMKKHAPDTVYTIKGTNTDSGTVFEEARFDGIDAYKVDNERLYKELVECRVIKTEAELKLMRWINSISSKAHLEVMQKCRPGMMEYELESMFLDYCYARGGARFVAYTCVCAAGDRSGTLHYGTNERKVEDGQNCLFDMGCEYHCYGSDITCSFPANGKFTEKQKTIYNTVLNANLAVQKSLKAGVLWPDMHRLSERVILEGLKAAGILLGSVDDMMKIFLGTLFMPHGLGHLMGLDVHDVGGYPEGVKRSTEPGLAGLRCGRVMEPGMVITIEPGCYFVPALLEPALKDPAKAKFLCKEKLAEYMDLGGVRIEDDVVVTKDGCEMMTAVPRTVGEIEDLMAKGRALYK